MGNVVQDMRYALRQLRKSPGFAVTAILILTIGIGASTAIFGFVDAALIRPLPYADPSRLVDVAESAAMFPPEQSFLLRLSRLEEVEPGFYFP
jgi:macrolide transport system ATP-binding/permease protein